MTDREDIAVAMAMGNAPQAVAMELQKEYAERYDWLVKEFTDLAFTFMTSFLYYMDYDAIDAQTRDLYRQGISTFGGISPTYRIALEKNSPVIVWVKKKRIKGRIKQKIRFYLLSHLAKLYHYDRIYVGVTKTGSGSPFAKMSTF